MHCRLQTVCRAPGLPYAEIWQYLPNLSVVVLERDLNQRWKSYWLAQKTNDWDVTGSAAHKERLASLESSIPAIDTTFQYRHERWYNFVNSLFAEDGSLFWVPHINVAYDEVVSDPDGTRNRTMNMILSEPLSHNRNHTEEEEWYDMLPIDYGGYTVYHKKWQLPTSSFENCSSSPSVESHYGDAEEEVTMGSGSVTVSCRTFGYRVDPARFKKPGQIISGILSASESRKRRDVRCRWRSSGCILLC